MNTMTIDTSRPDQLSAAFALAMRGNYRRIILTGSAPTYEQRAKDAGIRVEAQSSTR